MNMMIVMPNVNECFKLVTGVSGVKNARAAFTERLAVRSSSIVP